MSPEPVSVAILVYPETTGAVVYGMYDIFCSVGRDWELITEGRAGNPRIRPLLVSRQAEAFSIGNDIPVRPDTSLPDCPPVPFIVVPEVNLPPGTRLAPIFGEEIEWLQARYAAGAVLAAGCSGPMLLAEAGLLDGQRATAHWAWCDVLRERFPRVQVHPQRTLVVSGEQQRIVMAGGGASFLDLTLYLIARMLDVETAMQVARVNLIDWHHVGQQPFARLARTRQVEDAIIARCQARIAEHYDEPAPVRSMVRLSGLAERTFKRKVNLTPAQYRKRFGALRRSLSSPEVAPPPPRAVSTSAGNCMR